VIEVVEKRALVMQENSRIWSQN